MGRKNLPLKKGWRWLISTNYQWNNEAEARQDILNAVAAYYAAYKKTDSVFVPGDKINYGGRVYDEKEMRALTDAALDFWLTADKYADRFEKNFAAFNGVRFASLVNSGSSANLLAFMALTAPELGDRRIQRGDEIITAACAFPTTVSPIIQYGAVPVFLDMTIPQYNIDVNALEKALSPKTKAVMLAHTLGNPFDLNALRDFCDRHHLWLIEDACDALGAEIQLDGQLRKAGAVGDIGTCSFFPAHHITTGEGGCVFTNNPDLHRIVNSMRDWGRDCVCPSGKDNRCGRRFDQQFGELPFGYDHKYVYSHFGYNLKVTDLQAAIGCEQLEKLPDFISARRRNWRTLRELLDPCQEWLTLPEPEAHSVPSWFGFVIAMRDGSPISRDQMVAHLEKNGVQTRMLFSGNIILHPCFDEMRQSGVGYRVIGDLENTQKIMRDVFWVGVYPGMNQEKLEWIAKTIREIL